MHFYETFIDADNCIDPFLKENCWKTAQKYNFDSIHDLLRDIYLTLTQ